MHRKVLCFLFAVFVGCSSLIAQKTHSPITPSGSDTSTWKPFKQKYFNVYLGLFINGNVGLNTNPATGYKSGVDYGIFDYGLCFFQPFTSSAKTGFGLDVGYTSINYKRKELSGTTVVSAVPESYNYLSIFPHFYLNGFVLGLQYGMQPSGGEGRNLASVILPKIGLSLPVVDDDWGQMRINFNAGYAFNGLYEAGKDYPYMPTPIPNPPLTDDQKNEYNPRPVVLSIGLTFMMVSPIYY